MLRRILLASAGTMALAGAAFAADLPSRAPPPVFLPPPPVYTWTGLYIGVNAGYEWAASKSIQTTTFPQDAVLDADGDAEVSGVFATGSVPLAPNGFIGGGQIGFNFQFANSWVVGIETDIQGIAGSKRNGSFSGNLSVGNADDDIVSTVASEKRTDWLGTLRGRFGFPLAPTLLIYGTGGLAYGEVETSTSVTGSPAFATFGSLSNARVGWTAGGGVEWMFLPNWSAKVEYLYYDLGRVTYALSPLTIFETGGSRLFSGGSNSSTRFNGNIVRAGLNYHFNLLPAPVVAKY